ncbi:MAG: cytochrome b N-terminal domain-containing protein [Pyrinomonadaceae bacterium]
MELRQVAKYGTFKSWLSRETEMDTILQRLTGEPATGIEAWARTTSGLITLLLFLQILTGILMAFHYVPSTNTAYTTVTYIELAVSSGSWLRSLHYHSSILLPIVLSLHLAQMILRGSFRRHRAAWVFAIALLGLCLAAGATGYALPWDARSLNGVNIAASLAANVPLIGPAAGAWLINGTKISTLTLSRFYGLHVFILPMLISTVIVGRFFIFGRGEENTDREPSAEWRTEQLARNAVVIGIAFAALAYFATVFPAPLGPQTADSATYLPRPGPQFLWLFEMQKYTDGALAAMLALGFPGLVLGGLTIIPLVISKQPRVAKAVAACMFVFGFGAVAALTSVAIYQDSSDSRIAAQLAKQANDEAEFRKTLFEPKLLQPDRHVGEVEPNRAANSDPSAASPPPVPHIYSVNCAKCHGAAGEGTAKFPELTGITDRDEDPLTPEMVLAIINDPKSVGYSSKMPAYKNKLSDNEKAEIVSWIRSLKPTNAGSGSDPVTTARVEETTKKEN